MTYTDERARAQIMPFLPPLILGSRRYGAPHGRTEKDFHCVFNKQDKVRSVGGMAAETFTVAKPTS